MRNFKITEWPSMTLVKRNNFSKARALFVVQNDVKLFVLLNCCHLRKLFI